MGLPSSPLAFLSLSDISPILLFANENNTSCAIALDRAGAAVAKNRKPELSGATSSRFPSFFFSTFPKKERNSLHP